MRTRVVVLALVIAASPASSATICPLKAPQGDVVVFRSRDALDACRAEMEATGKPATICGRGMVATVPNGTSAQYLSAAGADLTKVRILEGPDAGVEGVVRMDFCKF